MDVIEFSLSVPSEHEVFAGHFPGQPIVPGALLLQWVFVVMDRDWGVSVLGVKSIKFLSMVEPGQKLQVRLAAGKPGVLKLTIHSEQQVVLEGNLLVSTSVEPEDK